MDTKMGVHSPSDYNWVPSNLIAFCEDLRRHGVYWITGWWNCRVQVEFAKALTDHGIRTIYRPGENKIPSQFIGGDYEQYRRAGAEFCQFYNEPNLSAEWRDDRKMNPEFFAENWAEKCKALKAIGFTPVVPPLSPGGNFWHPDFFRRMVQWWKDHGMLPDLLRGCVLGIHNRPTTNPPDATGVCSFEGYRFYRQTMQDMMGFTLPMVAPEAGYQPEDCGHDWNRWCDWNMELIRRFQPTHPKYVGADFLAHCFWIYSDSGSTWDACGLVENWYYAQDHGGDRTTNLWRALEAENWGTLPTPPIPVPTPSPTPEPRPEVPMGIEFVNLTEEMIEALSISGPAVADQPYWKVVKVEIQPQTDNQSAWVIAPGGHFPKVLWSTGEAVMPWKQPDPYAPPGARQGAYSQPLFDCWGNYGVVMEANSEAVRGLGLYGDPPDLNVKHTAHHPVLVYFQLVEPGPTPEPPPVTPPAPEPVPEPEPIPSIPYEFGNALSTRLVAAGLPPLVDLREEIKAKYARLALVGTRSREVKDRVAVYKSITIHHTGATGPLNVLELAKYHWKPEADGGRGYPIIAYHIVIDEAGKVTWTKPFMLWSAQAGSFWVNKTSIAVALQGNFVSGRPKDAQLEALECVVDSIEEWVGEAQRRWIPLPILPHKAVTDTQCPGRLYEEYVDWRRL